jgi:hypothetical protein
MEGQLMTILGHGDPLLPEGFGADQYDIRFSRSVIVIDMRTDDGESVTLEASGVMSFRFSYEEVYLGYLEGSLDKLLILENPAWELRYRDEDTPFGELVREMCFYHLNIPDVGILECWAKAITRRSSAV